MKPTIEELEAAKERLHEIGEGGLICELPNGSATIDFALTQAIAIQKGESVVVPREPTFDMVYAAHSKTQKEERWGWTSIYKAMIEEAQEGAKDE